MVYCDFSNSLYKYLDIYHNGLKKLANKEMQAIVGHLREMSDENQDEILKIAESINIDKIQLKVNDIKIMNVKHNSYCLYLSIEENQQIMELQRIFYREFPKEKYNPDDFNFHMTLDIDKDYNKVLNLQKTLKENFKSFFLEFNTVALFDYPGDMVKKINLNKNNKK